MGALSEPVMPTAFLPPLKQLHTCSSGALSLALQRLTQLYRPTSDRRVDSYTSKRTPVIIDSGYASPIVDDPSVDEEELWEIARSEPRERDFAIRWMTGFLARGLEWAEGSTGDDDTTSELELEDREAVYDGISSLLSVCSSASEGGALLREFVFPQPQPGVKHAGSTRTVKVVLKDEDLNTTDHTGVGLQTWGSASIMAERLVRSPHLYGLVSPTPSSPRPRPLRILELGAGTGLLSLVIGTLLLQSGIEAEIVATDYHPAVLANLRDNISANPDASSSVQGCPGVSISVAALNWELFHNPDDDELAGLGNRFAEPFDVIIAADVVYRPQHAQWLSSVVRKLLRKPTSSSQPVDCAASFHLIAPTRPTHEHTHASIRDAFSPSPSSSPSPATATGVHAYEGLDPQSRLQIVQCIDHARVKGNGRADESGYREYRVEWR